MEKQSENRRVFMTKRLLKEALLNLLEEQELASISVTVLCDAADIHRSTFYKYYNSPTDLLTEIEQSILNQIPTPSQTIDEQNQDQLLQETTAFFDFLKENDKALRVLFSEKSGSTFSLKLVEYLCNNDYVPVGMNKDDLSAEFIQCYIANGTVGMMRKWIESGYKLDSRKLAEMMYFLSKKINQ